MWIVKWSSTIVLVAIAGLGGTINNSQQRGCFCTALPQPPLSLHSTNRRKKVQLNGNPVFNQDNPAPDLKMRGQYSPVSKEPTSEVLKAVFAVLASSGAITILKGFQEFRIFDKVSLFDWTKPVGAFTTSAIVYAILYSVIIAIIPFLDGLRGVDRSRRHGGILKQGFLNRWFNIQAPPPVVGLAIAVAITVKLPLALADWLKVDAFINTTTAAGCILLAAISIPVFFGCLLLLPVDIPDPELYLLEDDPSALRRILRYVLLPISPVIQVFLMVRAYVDYWNTLVHTRTAFDKVGTSEMDVSSADTVGKPIGFTLAQNVMDSSDRTLSRIRVLVEKNYINWKEWLLRKPIPREDVKVPSDEQVWSICSKTVLSYNIMDEIEGEGRLGSSETCLDMTPMQHFITLPNYHYNVARVYLLAKEYKEGIPSTGVVTRIVMNDGKVIKKGDPEWDLAKLHFIATANLFFPAMQHNWVHFHFVDGATAMAHSIFTRGSVLHRIIQPFILSNVYTNGHGLGGVVVALHPTFANYNVDINPTANEYFVNSIHHRSLAFYTGKSDYVLSNDVLKERVRFGFPPKFMKNDQVPYTVCLKKSYEAFQVFARKVVDIISEDSDALITFQHWCNEVVRRTSDTLLAANVDHVDILATFMWQVSLLHSLDHNAFFYRVEPMNGFSGAMCDFKSHEARRNMYTADNVRIYREFIKVAGKYYLSKLQVNTILDSPMIV